MAKPLDFDGDHGARYVEEIRKAIPGYEALHTLTATLLKGRLAETGRILVVGCGGGEECLRLNDAHAGWTITGVDPSAQMVGIARRRVGDRPGIELIEGALESVGSDDPFDAATSMLVLHFIRGDEGKQAHLQGIADRLRPGGVLIVACLIRHDDSPLGREVEGAWEGYLLMNGIDPAILAERMEGVKESTDPVEEEQVERLLEDAGFNAHRRFYQGLRFAAWIALKG